MEGRIGRIGKSINNRKYLYCCVKGVELYIEKTLVDELPETGGTINALMGYYGSWTDCGREHPSVKFIKDGYFIY